MSSRHLKYQLTWTRTQGFRMSLFYTYIAFKSNLAAQRIGWRQYDICPIWCNRSVDWLIDWFIDWWMRTSPYYKRTSLFRKFGFTFNIIEVWIRQYEVEFIVFCMKKFQFFVCLPSRSVGNAVRLIVRRSWVRSSARPHILRRNFVMK